MNKLAFAAAFTAAMAVGAASFFAFAQTDESASPPERAARLQAALEARAQTRPRLAPPRLGLPAKPAEEDRINWTEMRTALALSARRDTSAGQTTAAVIARPPGMRAAAAENFKTVVTREVNVTHLPVLAPEGSRIAQTLKVYSLGSSYSATAEVEKGVAMRMSGARKKLVIGDLRSARTRIAAMRKESRTLGSVDAPYLVTRSESSTDLTFAKFGAGYVLSIMCDDPADARCAEDDFIVKLASNLLLLNPEAEGE
ncbi:MAG: hypothetical protein KDE05_06695 [Parvularculaceae bacterium]|nr:hypothetical protein [Parvularculaceae bacterium]